MGPTGLFRAAKMVISLTAAGPRACEQIATGCDWHHETHMGVALLYVILEAQSKNLGWEGREVHHTPPRCFAEFTLSEAEGLKHDNLEGLPPLREVMNSQAFRMTKGSMEGGQGMVEPSVKQVFSMQTEGK